MNNSRYIKFLQDWKNNLPTLSRDILRNPNYTAIVGIDLIKGFCVKGALYSERCKKIAKRATNLFNLLYMNGAKSFSLIQDYHKLNAAEFLSFPEHCTEGSIEAEPVNELQNLVFYNSKIAFYEKNATGIPQNAFRDFLFNNKNITTFVITGVCTDICVYQFTTTLLSYINENTMNARIIVPENCVATYDSENHPGDFYHLMFLYSMQINGIEIVKEIN